MQREEAPNRKSGFLSWTLPFEPYLPHATPADWRLVVSWGLRLVVVGWFFGLVVWVVCLGFAGWWVCCWRFVGRLCVGCGLLVVVVWWLAMYSVKWLNATVAWVIDWLIDWSIDKFLDWFPNTYHIHSPCIVIATATVHTVLKESRDNLSICFLQQKRG